MKKKCLAVLMAVCVFSAFPSVLNCQCVAADCGSVPQTTQANVPQCHHAAASEKGGNSSPKDCCGKCRLEKAAVLSAELLPASDVRPRNTLTEIGSFADFYSKVQRPAFFHGAFSESPPRFFEQKVLNTAFSVRAPPQG